SPEACSGACKLFCSATEPGICPQICLWDLITFNKPIANRKGPVEICSTVSGVKGLIPFSILGAY
ncbi:MAG: hypothetical protein JSV01_07020, partial [Desulfobacterales bacterium]